MYVSKSYTKCIHIITESGSYILTPSLELNRPYTSVPIYSHSTFANLLNTYTNKCNALMQIVITYITVLPMSMRFFRAYNLAFNGS